MKNRFYQPLLLGLAATGISFALFVFRNVFWLALEPGLFGRSQPLTWLVVSGIVGFTASTASFAKAAIRKK
jgi:hypothetical protein